MTLDELEAAAQGDGSVFLVLPWQTRGEFIRLGRTVGPLGEIINVNRDGHTVARFSKKSIRRAVARERLRASESRKTA